ncbi:recombinase family protein [Nocardia brasiliensis]|uniref:recombinase family protein n=1 Tax=Nocardia brasiliensis TaxID=37326 RepID=UPI002B4AEB5A|nr:recombinase family protein [Nocardia brasiliensis]
MDADVGRNRQQPGHDHDLDALLPALSLNQQPAKEESMPSDTDEWAVLDELLGIEVASPESDASQRLAFYGRCSTEDNQDPESSYAWQYNNADRFTVGTIVESYFDIGQSRSVPWDRRTEAARLLATLRNPNRGWSGIVVGEGTRCWFGAQFSMIAPRLESYGVDLWIPELGGRYDPQNPSHNMLMSMLGGMSESERQHVQKRTRAAMDAQVANEGRHQGGRAPYGYVVIDGPPHPNPGRAAQGLKLRILAIDEFAARIVRRIFAEYQAGHGDRAIAVGLNHEGVLCPSAHTPHQNSHRSGDGWQASTVRAILENPRYTGYAFFGRWTKHEELLDRDDVAAGKVVRFRKSSKDRVVRSRRPAHPAIVSVETYTQVQLARRARGGAGMQQRAKLERTRVSGRHLYRFRSRIRCDDCDRKMEGGTKGNAVWYRCRASTLAPGSPASEGHPKTVNLAESRLIVPVNNWIATVFDRHHRTETISTLLAAQADADGDLQRQLFRQRLAAAETKLHRYQIAIEAGVDVQALIEPMNQAQAERAIAQAEMDAIPAIRQMTAKELEKLIDSLGDIKAVLSAGAPEDQAALYEALHLEIRYRHRQQLAVVSAGIPVVNTCVRRGT